MASDSRLPPMRSLERPYGYVSRALVAASYPLRGVYYFLRHPAFYPLFLGRLLPLSIISILVYLILFTFAFLPQFAFLAIFHGRAAWLNAVVLVLGEGLVIIQGDPYQRRPRKPRRAAPNPLPGCAKFSQEAWQADQCRSLSAMESNTDHRAHHLSAAQLHPVRWHAGVHHYHWRKARDVRALSVVRAARAEQERAQACYTKQELGLYMVWNGGYDTRADTRAVLLFPIDFDCWIGIVGGETGA
ncbi:hypothetical protein NPX13_g1792 [Xylaria arbuscula]|uniref:Uncharacterized protein n=1 Tax=Xylaria arbuscula TaxID=114810 RepID=A0A9W8NKS8_9PEZI|nr:hypothetical protein NPX13_g1792 [Xylaria arbuscula]